MFRAKTVLILGAGASVDLGLPMGAELLQRIRSMLDFEFDFGTRKKGDREIFDALRLQFRNDPTPARINDHLAAAEKIHNSALQAMSIDNLVHALEDETVAVVAKMAIVRAIHAAERKSLCAPRRFGDMDLSAFHNHWYSSLSRLLFEQVTVSSLDQIFQNLEIINFNYDRCLEAYLPQSIATYFSVQPWSTQELMARLPIHRPYGIAGELSTVPFGPVPADRLLTVAAGIRTFTEQVSDDTALSGIRRCLEEADRIVFLGFAFHRQNMELLAADVQEHTEVLATAFGISKNDQDVIEDELASTFGIFDRFPNTRIHLSNSKCAEFFNENWRTLTADPPEN